MYVFNDNGWFIGQEIFVLFQVYVYSGFCYQVIDIKSILVYQVMKICFCGDYDDLICLCIQFNEVLEECVYFCFFVVDCLEVLLLGCNKGLVLVVLSNYLGFLLVDCMVFGDVMNDWEMFGSVGWGFIMGNVMLQFIVVLLYFLVIGYCGN